MDGNYFKGRGAQVNTSNPFLVRNYVEEHPEGIDERLIARTPEREIFHETPKKVINHVNSPDLRLEFSINPYQGCEHGCVYCYARNAHHYLGLSAGLDFESKIFIKRNAAEILEQELLKGSWKPTPIMLSGNTDCYQPIEKKFKLTRSLLKVFAKYRHPVSIITKNALILRDLDLLKNLASDQLVSVFISITSMDEKLRLKMEPRTVTSVKRLDVVKKLSGEGIPVGVMIAPVIPGINDHEIPSLVKTSAEHGALTASYTVVRLNGAVGEIFYDWLRRNFPERSEKVWNLICSMHGGKVNDTKWERRIRGEGNISQMISMLFKSAKKKYFKNKSLPDLRTDKFRKNGNLNLF